MSVMFLEPVSPIGAEDGGRPRGRIAGAILAAAVVVCFLFGSGAPCGRSAVAPWCCCSVRFE